MINNVSELVVEAARISGRGDLVSYAPMLLGFLEQNLNSEIRHRSMVASTTLSTNASGVATLPSDYLETIVVTYGTDKKHLNRITREMYDLDVDGYYIDGGNFVSIKTGTDHTFKYYQSIPGLWSNGTNWLLTTKPEIYLRGLVFEALKDAMDERAPQAKDMLDMALADLRDDDTRARRIDTVAMPRTQI